jgi:transcriptional regulator with XRE-family HTH domain
MAEDAMHFGKRIRYWRRRRGGMSQATLAGLAGLSQAYISQAETGMLSIDRRSTLVRIAQALQISVADLIGQPGDPTEPNKVLAALAVPEIRVALAELEAGVVTEPGPRRDEIVEGLDRVDAKRLDCDFAGATPMLPGLIRGSAPHEPALRGQVLHVSASLLRFVGYRDLAWRASDMAVACAREADDLALLGACQFTRLKCLPPEAFRAVAAQARQTCEELQPCAGDPAVRRGYGSLHLTAALADAQANRPDLVAEHLAEAQAEAATLGEPPRYGGISMSFGPINVGLWAMGSALESGEYHRVIELAREIHTEGYPDGNRRSSYWLDLGRALMHVRGRDRQAVVAFARAEAEAPQFVHVLPAARDAVSALIARARQRALADDLRRLADRMGLGGI